MVIGIVSLLCIAATQTVAAETQDYQITTIAEGLDQPFGMAIMPSGDLFITERASGQLRLIENGRLLPEPVTGVPKVYVGLYGGLLDVVLHPQFSSNQWVYMTLTQGTDKANSLRVVRGQYSKGEISNVVEIYKATPDKKNSINFSGKMAFLPDQTLLISIGDGHIYREEAQNLNSSLGKIIRFTDEGRIPPDNPFVGQENKLPEIWSYGFRNVLGLMYSKLNNVVFAHENAHKGGDELNRIESGKNYGWPIATYTTDYSGGYVSPLTHHAGVEQPLTYWTPSLAPSGMTQCVGCQWKEWEGDLLVSMLGGKQIRRIRLSGDTVTEQEALFTELNERIRDVQFSQDGALYILTDNHPIYTSADLRCRLLKVSPVK